MIRASLIDEVFDNLTGRITDSFSWIGEYVFVSEVVALGFVALLVLGALSYFVPFTWARQFFGYLGSMIIAGLAGVIWMFKQGRTENRRLRDEIKNLKSHKEEDQPKRWW